MSILKYIIKRILQTIPLLIIVSLISFFIIRLSPVDPLAELRLNPSVSKETLQKETERLGLDKPIIVQYGKWAKSFIKGDLGVTSNGEQVSTKLKERIPNTLLLTCIVIFLSWAVGVPLGILAAVYWKSPLDRVSCRWAHKFKFLGNDIWSKSLGYYASPCFACNGFVYAFACRVTKADEGKFA